MEEQAIDRAHRIGQTRTVHVTRLTIKGVLCFRPRSDVHCPCCHDAISPSSPALCNRSKFPMAIGRAHVHASIDSMLVQSAVIAL